MVQKTQKHYVSSTYLSNTQASKIQIKGSKTQRAKFPMVTLLFAQSKIYIYSIRSQYVPKKVSTCHVLHGYLYEYRHKKKNNITTDQDVMQSDGNVPNVFYKVS